MSIAVLCPTRDRPSHLAKLVNSVMKTSTNARVYAYIDEDQKDLYAPTIKSMDPASRLTVFHGNRVGPAASANGLLKHVDAEIYGLITDDSVVLTSGWDRWLEAAIDSFPGRIGVASPAHNHGPHVDMPFVSREWINRLGWFAQPGVRQYCWPSLLYVLALEIGPNRVRRASPKEFFIQHDELSTNANGIKDDAIEFYAFLISRLHRCVDLLTDRAVGGVAHGYHKAFPPNGDLGEWIAGHFDPGYSGYAIDVGASDGISVNTTYSLEKYRQWSVLCVEPNPQFRASLGSNRKLVAYCACGAEQVSVAPFYVHMDCAEAYSSLRPTKDHPRWKPQPDARWETIDVEVRTVDSLMEEHGFPRLDALCVDTEGTEMDVLRGVDILKWRPKVLVVESWDEGGVVEPYLSQFGYRRVWRQVVNDCYVREQ